MPCAFRLTSRRVGARHAHGDGGVEAGASVIAVMKSWPIDRCTLPSALASSRSRCHATHVRRCRDRSGNRPGSCRWRTPAPATWRCRRARRHWSIGRSAAPTCRGCRRACRGSPRLAAELAKRSARRPSAVKLVADPPERRRRERMRFRLRITGSPKWISVDHVISGRNAGQPSRASQRKNTVIIGRRMVRSATTPRTWQTR